MEINDIEGSFAEQSTGADKRRAKQDAKFDAKEARRDRWIAAQAHDSFNAASKLRDVLNQLQDVTQGRFKVVKEDLDEKGNARFTTTIPGTSADYRLNLYVNAGGINTGGTAVDKQLSTWGTGDRAVNKTYKYLLKQINPQHM